MTESDHADPMIGTLLDERYAIEHRIARGGMATIYLATDTKLRRRVAVKVLYPHLAEDPAFVHRFEAEAIAAAKLSHPHVVSVHDQGVDGDTAYLVMEYVPGATLRDVMRTQGKLSPRATLQLTDALLSGLAAAHAAGLVHRDVKPENVLLSPDGRIKVTDFGLARAASAHTATGALIGTVAYVSPELVTGNSADTRSDLYAVGIMIYEMLTARQPFTAETGWQVALKHVNETVPAPSEHVIGLAPDLDEVVAWCTRHDPEERPHDAEALRQELNHIAAGMTPAQLDLGESRTSIASLLSSTLAVLSRSAPPLPPDPSERGTTLVKGIPRDDDSTRSVSQQDPEGPTQALKQPASDSATRALPQQAASSSASPSDSGQRVPHTVPRLPRETNQVTRQAQPTRPLSNREERAQMRERARQAQRPTERLAKPGARKRLAIWTIIVVVIAAILGGTGWYFGAGPGGKVLIPNVSGQSASQATAKLSENGLSVSRKQVFDEKVDKGDVVSTDPAAGKKIRKFNSLKLLVSKGPHLYAVPNVVGLEEADASKALTKAKLKAGTVTEDFDESMPKGKVVSQAEPAGKELRSGMQVPFVVSKGPSPVKVPSLSGYDAQTAESVLKAAGFESEQGDDVFSDDVKEGQVARQDPSPGDEVSKNSTVTWQLSKGPDEVKIPNVFNKSTKDAKARLEDAGFTVKTNEGSFGVIFDRVASQSPKHGTKAKRGSTVTINVY